MESGFDIENVLAEIRQEIKDNGLEQVVLPFNSVPIRSGTGNGTLSHFLERCKERILRTAYFKVYLKTPQWFRSTVRSIRRSLVRRSA